jgi:hypothetical protein
MYRKFVDAPQLPDARKRARIGEFEESLLGSDPKTPAMVAAALREFRPQNADHTTKVEGEYLIRVKNKLRVSSWTQLLVGEPDMATCPVCDAHVTSKMAKHLQGHNLALIDAQRLTSKKRAASFGPLHIPFGLPFNKSRCWLPCRCCSGYMVNGLVKHLLKTHGGMSRKEAEREADLTTSVAFRKLG